MFRLKSVSPIKVQKIGKHSQIAHTDLTIERSKKGKKSKRPPQDGLQTTEEIKIKGSEVPPKLSHAIKEVENTIRINPGKNYVGISKDQLEILKNAGQNTWFDCFLATTFFFIPSLTNLILAWYKAPEPKKINLEIFINALLSFGSFVAAIIFFVIWKKQSNVFKKTIEEIEKQPLHRIE